MTTLDTSQRLYQRGLTDLRSRFDPAAGLVRDPFRLDRHQPHPSIWYASCLLREGDAATAERMIRAALALQERHEGDPHHGNFRWHLEDNVVIDLNACQFALEALLALPLDRLSAALRGCIVDAATLAFAEAKRLDAHWTYTNIHLLDIHNRILGGEILGLPDVQRQGIERLRAWAERTRAVGAPHEFNSPTYAAVDLNCLADLASRSQSPEARDLALQMEHLVWRHIARYWHAATGQLGGPHSRAYRRDVVGASGFLKVVLYRLLADESLLARTPYYEGPDSEGEVIVSRIHYHCPTDAEAMLRTPATRDMHETVSLAPRTEAVAYISPAFSLGTLSRPYGVGDPPEHWPMTDACIAYWKREQAPGYGVLHTRYRAGAGSAGKASREGVPAWLDIWEDGVFRSAQHGRRAVVAYGIAPRGMRQLDSLRLDIRLLGPQASHIVIDGQPWSGEALPLASGVPVVIADGDVYIGIVPLDPTRLGQAPTVVLWRDGDESVISIVNYEGPPKQFWEYRSLAGPFWKGNVRNGFALCIADRAEYATSEAFAAALAGTPLSDVTTGTTRTISFGAGEVAATVTYDLREMRL